MRLRCLVLITATFAAGCTSPSGWTLTEHIPTPSPVRVQLEQRETPDPAEPPYAHPAAGLDVALADYFLNTTYERRGKRRPAVHADRAPILARAIADALAMAGPSTRVRFSVDNPPPSLGVFNPGGTTRGVVFVRPAGTLNIVCDVVDDAIEFEDDTWADPVDVALSRGRIVPPPGSRRHVARAGEPTEFWIEMAVEARPVAVDTPPTEAAAAAEPTDPPAKPTAAPVDPKPTPALTDTQIVERLRYLDELRGRGAISAEEYERQRKALLNGSR